jgi:hypothetical protein
VAANVPATAKIPQGANNGRNNSLNHASLPAASEDSYHMQTWGQTCSINFLGADSVAAAAVQASLD